MLNVMKLKKSMERSTNDWLASQSRGSSQNINYVYKIGIYGWRKRLLYTFILLLMIMIIINLSLTLWIIKVMDFSRHGMGKLRILEQGLRLEGEGQFLHAISAEKIQSRPDRPLSIESAHHIKLNARDQKGDITTRLLLDDQQLQAYASHFIVKNKKGKTLFQASDDRIEIAAEMLKVTGQGGAVFEGAIQTKLVTSEYRSHLELESPSRELKVHAPESIRVESRGGEIFATCLNDVTLQARNGSVILHSNDVHIHDLPLLNVSPVIHEYEVDQLCSCKNGKLFVAPASGACYAPNEFCNS